MAELGRFFNAKDEPIVLSQTHNHARLVLTRASRHSNEALAEEHKEDVFELKDEDDDKFLGKEKNPFDK